MQGSDYSRQGNVLLQKMTVVEQSEKEKRRTTRLLERERYAPEAIQRVFLQQPVVLRQSALADQLSDDDEGDGAKNNSRSLLQQIQYEFQETVHDLQSAAKGVMDGLSDLNPLDERGRLRQSVRICADALVAVKLHAAVKIQHLQLQVVALQQELAEASGLLSKLTVENDSLRRQIDELQKEPQQPGVHTFRNVDLTAETHLNSLLLSRNQAIQENTNLKKMLLHTCPSCRERLPLRKAQRSMSISGSSVHSAEPQSPDRPSKTDSSTISSSSSNPFLSTQSQPSSEKQSSRPTWQATARSVLHRLQSEAPSDSHVEKADAPREKSTNLISQKSPSAQLAASKPDRNTPEKVALANEKVDRPGSEPARLLVRTPSALASQFKSHMRVATDSLPNEVRPQRTASSEKNPRVSAEKPRNGPPSRSSSGDSGRLRAMPPPSPSLVESSLNDLTSFLFPATTTKRPKGTF